MTIDVNDLTFGVEIEVTLPAGTCEVGEYHHGIQVPALPEGWKAEHDGSINYHGRRRRSSWYPRQARRMGAEIVSPILRGEEGIRQVQQVCRWLKSVGAAVNRSTGFHVHVGFAGQEHDATRRLVSIVANFEKAFYAATGTKNREHGRYCRTIQQDATYRRLYQVGQEGLPYERYHLLNLTNLDRQSKQTVEFRVFAGTLNAVKMIGYVRLCLGVVEKALTMKKLPPWIAKRPVESSPIHRGGDGQTALTRLFYYLGWTKGRESHTYGNVGATAGPSIRRIKKDLMTLAKKYDHATL